MPSQNEKMCGLGNDVIGGAVQSGCRPTVGGPQAQGFELRVSCQPRIMSVVGDT